MNAWSANIWSIVALVVLPVAAACCLGLFVRSLVTERDGEGRGARGLSCLRPLVQSGSTCSRRWGREESRRAENWRSPVASGRGRLSFLALTANISSRLAKGNR